MTVSDAADGQAVVDDAAYWQEASRLRDAHRDWVIIWLAPARQFRAYKRLAGGRRESTLAAATPDALAAAIVKAQQPASAN